MPPARRRFPADCPDTLSASRAHRHARYAASLIWRGKIRLCASYAFAAADGFFELLFSYAFDADASNAIFSFFLLSFFAILFPIFAAPSNRPAAFGMADAFSCCHFRRIH